jgi:hypothetical protein
MQCLFLLVFHHLSCENIAFLSFERSTIIRSGYTRDTCTPTLISALFSVAKLWKQQEKVVYIHDGVLLSHRNDMWFEGKWMQLEDIMLSELTRFRNTKATCFLSYVDGRSKTCSQKQV